jgi:hypothetical protein
VLAASIIIEMSKPRGKAVGRIGAGRICRPGPACCYSTTNRFSARGLLVALMMEAPSTSETPINFYETKRRYIPVGCYLHIRRRKNMKSQYNKDFYVLLEKCKKILK